MPYVKLLDKNDVPYFEELYYRIKDVFGSHGRAQKAVRMYSNQITNMRRDARLPENCAFRILAAYKKYVPIGHMVKNDLLYLPTAQKRALTLLMKRHGWFNCVDLNEEFDTLDRLVKKGLADMRIENSTRRHGRKTRVFIAT